MYHCPRDTLIRLQEKFGNVQATYMGCLRPLKHGMSSSMKSSWNMDDLPCLYTLRSSKGSIVSCAVLYVDDCLLTRYSDTINDLRKKLECMKRNNDPLLFLGLELNKRVPTFMLPHTNSFHERICSQIWNFWSQSGLNAARPQNYGRQKFEASGRRKLVPINGWCADIYRELDSSRHQFCCLVPS